MIQLHFLALYYGARKIWTLEVIDLRPWASHAVMPAVAIRPRVCTLVDQYHSSKFGSRALQAFQISLFLFVMYEALRPPGVSNMLAWYSSATKWR
jgi:hypothetical protein